MRRAGEARGHITARHIEGYICMNIITRLQMVIGVWNSTIKICAAVNIPISNSTHYTIFPYISPALLALIKPQSPLRLLVMQILCACIMERKRTHQRGLPGAALIQRVGSTRPACVFAPVCPTWVWTHSADATNLCWPVAGSRRIRFRKTCSVLISLLVSRLSRQFWSD